MKLENKKIEIFGTIYSIQFTKTQIVNLEGKDFLYGKTDYVNKIIEIALYNRDRVKIPDNEILITLIHEIIHAILNTGLYHAYNEDEPMVEFLARGINQVLKYFK